MVSSLAGWKNANTVAGLPKSTTSGPQSGVSNQDKGQNPFEKNLLLPYILDQRYSFLVYNCWIEVELDAGMALHKPLPQADYPADDLGIVDVASSNDLASNKNGVNTVSNGQYTDIVQRMATSTYIFKLRGYAIRIGYPIPIPKIVSVAGVTAIPAERQTAYNLLSGNFGGLPLYRARWDKWYYVTSYPKVQQPAPDNLSQLISGQQELPSFGIAVPYSMPDWNAVTQNVPEGPQGFTVRPGG